MSSPFVYRSLRWISVFSEGMLRHVNSLFVSLPVLFFSSADFNFLPILASFVSPNCVCYQRLTICMRNLVLCPHTPCPVKCLVLTHSTVVTISVSDSDKFTGETPN